MGRIPEGRTLPEFLRVGVEPYRCLSDADVHALLTADPAGYIAFSRDVMMAVADGRAQTVLPAKQVFGDPTTGGDFRVMPCELRQGAAMTKTVKLVGTNTIQRQVPDQITVGKLFVLDPRENFVSWMIDACVLSSARTGMCTALAISALAPRRRSLMVVGSGRVGYYSALYAVAACGVAQVTFCDRVPERARAAADALAVAFPAAQVDARPVGAMRHADIVALATTSAAPVASPPGWGAGLVVSLGADTDAQSELDPSWTECADLFCDTPDSLRFGDLLSWNRSGRITGSAVRDLLDVMRAPPTDSGRTRVFVSTGSALFDNVTARYLLERAPRPAK